MPLPFLIMAAAIGTGVVGVGKGVKGVLDSSEADDVQKRATGIVETAKEEVAQAKESVKKDIENLGKTKLEISAKEIKEFVDCFSQIKNVSLTDSVGLEELSRLNITESSLKEMKQTSLEASDVLSGGIAGIGAGALLGWGTYGGVMALGTASTGAAIGGLSGAAATNATLAWLGGGSLAAGGGGMAVGAAVLGGVIAVAAVLLAGSIFGAKAKEKLNNAYSNLAEAKKAESEMKSAVAELQIIGEKAKEVEEIIRNMAVFLHKSNDKLRDIVARSKNWKQYSNSEKNSVIAAMKNAQLVKGLIDIPLLTEDGILTKEIREVSARYQNAMVD